MKVNFRKITSVLLVCAMLLTMNIFVSAFGLFGNAETEENISFRATYDKETLNIGDIVTVKLYTKAMNASSYAFVLYFDNTVLTCTKVTTSNLHGVGVDEDEEEIDDTFAFTAKSSKKQTNENSSFGCSFAGSYELDYEADQCFATLQFEAVSYGLAQFSLYEDSVGNSNVKKKFDHVNPFDVQISPPHNSGDLVLGQVDDSGKLTLPDNTDKTVLEIPKGTTDLSAIVDAALKFKTVVLDGFELNSTAGIAAIKALEPSIVYCHKTEAAGLFEALVAEGLNVKDIISFDAEAKFVNEGGVNKVRLIGKIATPSPDFSNLSLTVTFKDKQSGTVVKTWNGSVGAAYSTVKGVATVYPVTAATQNIELINDASCVFALSFNGVPAGTYTVSATLTSAVGSTTIIGGALAETDVTVA